MILSLALHLRQGRIILDAMNDKKKILSESIPRAEGAGSSVRVNPVFTCLGIQTLKDEYSFSPHVHSQYELILVEEGNYQCLLNGVEINLARGWFLVAKPGDRHSDTCRPPLRYFGLRFYLDSAGISSDSNARGLFLPSCDPESQTGELEKSAFLPILDRIAKETKISDAISPHIQDAALLELFWLLVRELPKDGMQSWFLNFSFEQAFATRLTRYFNANIDVSVSVADMARYMKMGESSFAHKCRAILGASPAQSFMKYKMEEAARMLAASSAPVKEIGAYFGYDNQYHFSRAFKSCMGKSPTDFRRFAENGIRFAV